MHTTSIRNRPRWTHERHNEHTHNPHHDDPLSPGDYSSFLTTGSSLQLSTPSVSPSINDQQINSMTSTPRQVSFEDGHSDDKEAEDQTTTPIPSSSFETQQQRNSGRKRSLMRRPKTSLSLVDMAKSPVDEVLKDGADCSPIKSSSSNEEIITTSIYRQHRLVDDMMMMDDYQTEEERRTTKRLRSPTSAVTPSTSYSLISTSFSLDSPASTTINSPDTSNGADPWGHFVELPDDENQAADRNGELRYMTPLSFYKSTTTSLCQGPTFPSFLPSSIRPTRDHHHNRYHPGRNSSSINNTSGVRRSRVSPTSSSYSRTRWSRTPPRHLHLTSERFNRRTASSTSRPSAGHERRSMETGQDTADSSGNRFRLLPRRHGDAAVCDGDASSVIFGGTHESLIGAFSGLELDRP
mmetsp:Transcript_59395/g.145347  ORF Transcript_59395/g.145347 Transcript_59395/m.145347 type:complete len:409 (+) Transcript_59395:1030-2256(+)